MAKDDVIAEIRAIEDKYGLMLFRMGLTHAMDVGISNFGDENVAECIKQIEERGKDDKANGIIKVMTPAFECAIVRCAAELAKFGIWNLIRYIKKHVVVDGK